MYLFWVPPVQKSKIVTCLDLTNNIIRKVTHNNEKVTILSREVLEPMGIAVNQEWYIFHYISSYSTFVVCFVFLKVMLTQFLIVWTINKVAFQRAREV